MSSEHMTIREILREYNMFVKIAAADSKSAGECSTRSDRAISIGP